MRILLAGASGVLGRATLAHLDRHDVVGLTRTPEKLQLISELGAEALVCDVYDYPTLFAIAQRARPQIVVNFLTALTTGSDETNNRIRREGATNLLNIAKATKAARLVVESVSFHLRDDAARALEELEHSTRDFPREALILRFGRFWGPSTSHQTPTEPPTIQIDKAGAEAAKLITDAPPGTYLVTS
jgi:nucleoside-diphosphate-sugar epimerase